jgi:nucleoside-diphosphate-sugar epimerase
MRIIITGASGFLGQHLVNYFAKEEIITVGRRESKITAHLDREVPVLPQADLVIHNAGKAHMVPKTAAEVQDFFAVNVQGTKNLLNALTPEDKLPKSFLFISTIAVYGLDTGTMISEDSPLLATDPYGKSKREAELLVQEWCGKHDIPYAILRLPLIAGSKPPGNLNSMIKGIKKGYYFNMANGKARKSMVMANSVPAAILPAIAAGGVFNLTDGYHPSFAELSKLIALQLNKNEPGNMPEWVAKLLLVAGGILGERFPLTKKSYKKMINDLTFDDAKARRAFGWSPVKVVDNFKI